MNINKTIEKVSKRNLVSPAEFTFRFRGERHTFTLYRHFDGRDVSLCNRARCNAGDGCCHYAKVDGVGLCCSLSDYYDLRIGEDLSHGVAFNISYTDEQNLKEFARNILDIISGERKLPTTNNNVKRNTAADPEEGQE